MGKEIHYGATAVIQARDDKKGLKLGMWTPSAVNTKNGIRSTALHVEYLVRTRAYLRPGAMRRALNIVSCIPLNKIISFNIFPHFVYKETEPQKK